MSLSIYTLANDPVLLSLSVLLESIRLSHASGEEIKIKIIPFDEQI